MYIRGNNSLVTMSISTFRGYIDNDADLIPIKYKSK